MRCGFCGGISMSCLNSLVERSAKWLREKVTFLRGKEAFIVLIENSQPTNQPLLVIFIESFHQVSILVVHPLPLSSFLYASVSLVMELRPF